jgi:hypothetical protein
LNNTGIFQKTNKIISRKETWWNTLKNSILSILNHADIDSDREVLGYGVSLILLNIGMYAAIPTVIIIGIIKKI